MSDIVVDSCIVVKWFLEESDSVPAHQVISRAKAEGRSLVMLDLARLEVANAVWKRMRQKIITLQEARQIVEELQSFPVQIERAEDYLIPAFEIAAKYDRSIYDALFVALANAMNATGVTSDQPLVQAVRVDYSNIQLLRDF